MMLAMLAKQGVSQQQVGLRTGLGPQYVSDVKSDRRRVTELFARRLGEEFGVDVQWLLGTDTIPGLVARKSPSRMLPIETAPLVLPVLPILVEGDPRHARCWDGTTAVLTGQAAHEAGRSRLPYIWKLGHGDRNGRMRVNDLVLMSQDIDPDATIAVVRLEGELRLARVGKGGQWRDVESRHPLLREPEFVGRAIAVIWAPLWTRPL